MPEAWDIVVVGAGPAGSTLAARLAARGWSVLLLDQARFPRRKICGEYFGPGCLPLLEEIGAAAEVLRRAHRSLGIRAVSPGGVEFSAAYRQAEPAFSLPREELDSILLERARRQPPVTVREGLRVEAPVVEDGVACGVVARQGGGKPVVLRARVVVGADGRNSVLARRLGLFRWNGGHRRFSVGLHWEDVNPASAYGEIYAGRGLYGILNQQGHGRANLSIVCGQERVGIWKGNLENGLKALMNELPRLRDRLEGARPAERVHALGPLAHEAVRPGAPGVLLVGDAAKFYDPFTGEGVYMALLDARLAARTIEAALRQGGLTQELLRRHARRRNQQLGLRYAVQSLIQRILACPRSADVVARLLAGQEGLAERLLEFLGGARHRPWNKAGAA
ncbi:MAG: FAD-dependent monooxygenase [Bryobacteraceae bacterium]|nr:FAD-dependent monooxygenase [Bryobacteraceae bacterium]